MLLFITVLTGGLCAAITLWWNSELSGIINLVSSGRGPGKETLVTALVIMGSMGFANYLKSLLSGCFPNRFFK